MNDQRRIDADNNAGAIAAAAIGSQLNQLVDQNTTDRKLRGKRIDPNAMSAAAMRQRNGVLQHAAPMMGQNLDPANGHVAMLTPDLAASASDAELIDDPELRKQYIESYGATSNAPVASVDLSKLNGAQQLPPPQQQQPQYMAQPQTILQPAVDNSRIPVETIMSHTTIMESMCATLASIEAQLKLLNKKLKPSKVK